MVSTEFFRDDLEHLLPHFIEECGEALAAAGKALRWGLDSYNPTLLENEQELNMEWLHRELLDVLYVGEKLKLALGTEIYDHYAQ